MKMLFKVPTIALSLCLFASTALADSIPVLQSRVNQATQIFLNLTDGSQQSIPTKLLEKSVCIATFPNVIHVGAVFGGRYGNGVVSCRTGESWSNPSFVKLRSGSWGAQIGAEAADVVLIFTNKSSVDYFSQYNFVVGAESQISIGPVGRDAEPDQDYSAYSDVYVYALTKGVFAGVTIEGTSLASDPANNAQIYGMTPTDDLLSRSGYRAPAIVRPYVKALMENAK